MRDILYYTVRPDSSGTDDALAQMAQVVST